MRAFLLVCAAAAAAIFDLINKTITIYLLVASERYRTRKTTGCPFSFFRFGKQQAKRIYLSVCSCVPSSMPIQFMLVCLSVFPFPTGHIGVETHDWNGDNKHICFQEATNTTMKQMPVSSERE